MVWLVIVACGGKDDATEPPPVEQVDVEVVAGGPVTCDGEGQGSGWYQPERRDGTIVDQEQALTGGGLLVEDLDDDGHLDLFVPVDRDTDGAVAFWGIGDGSFERDGVAFAAVEGANTAGVSAADVDADGDLDVVLAGWGRPQQLFLNQGGRTFVAAPDRFPDGPSYRSQSVTWGDADGDGDLDLFVGSYGPRTVIDVREPEPDCSDHLPDPAELWLNDGTGHFVDASDQLPAVVHDSYTFASGWYDTDGDGRLELFIANDDGLCVPSLRMRREDDGRFVADAEAGFHSGSHDMSLGVADLNDDGRPDFLLTSWNRITLLESTDTPRGTVWVDATAARGFTIASTPVGQPASPGEQVFGWGAEFGDLDNDGDLDAIAMFGYWDSYPGPADPLTQADALWVQTDGQFAERAPEFGLDADTVGRAVVLADLDGNGALDIIKRVLDQPNPMYLRRCTDAAWVTLRLRDPGSVNPFAVGARVTVVAGGQTHTRWVTSGGTGLYTGAPLQVHVGLGDVDRIDSITVRWPDGAESTLTDQAARQHLTLARRR